VTFILKEPKMFALSSLLATFRRGQIRRSAAHTLRTLSPAQLADLGIASDGIDDVVDGLIAHQGGLPPRARTGSAAVAMRGPQALGAAG
jgi:uncharacterized protein YjiS (DUF1127 family)